MAGQPMSNSEDDHLLKELARMQIQLLAALDRCRNLVASERTRVAANENIARLQGLGSHDSED